MDSPTDPTGNTTGALIFTTYVLAALILTSTISYNLYKQYTNSHNHDIQQKRRIRLFTTLSLLSFSILSYHMLHFLILSYTTFLTYQSPSFKTSTLPASPSGFLTSLRQWLLSSTSFHSFATEIVKTPHRFWWTQATLLWSMGVNIWMAIEGTKNSIPNLPLYFILDQILPVSFTQNLFSLALLLYSSKPAKTPSPSPPPKSTPFIFIPILLTYHLILYLTPTFTSSSSPLFIPQILLLRFLLFLPFLFFRNNHMSPASTKPVYITFLILGLFQMGIQTWKVLGSVSLATLNETPAVSALGYDFLIAVGSAGVFLLMQKIAGREDGVVKSE